SHDSRQVTVLFPASTDVRWYKAPKFQAGEKGLFILHKTKIKTDEHRELRGLAPEEGGEVEVYTALHPDDVQPLKQQYAIKALFRYNTSGFSSVRERTRHGEKHFQKN